MIFQLVSSKYLTAFSDFRIPKDLPDFLPAEAYLQYLGAFADEFGLRSHIQCSTKVSSIKPHPTKPGHIVDLVHTGEKSGTDAVHGPVYYDAVAICSGLHQTPIVPDIPGLLGLCKLSTPADDCSGEGEQTAVKIMHSADFKSRAQFGEGKTVLILGAGETASE